MVARGHLDQWHFGDATNESGVQIESGVASRHCHSFQLARPPFFDAAGM